MKIQNQIKIFTVSLGTAVLLSACGAFLNQGLAQMDLNPVAQEKISSDFSFVHRAIFQPRCVSCHQQYDTYQGVIRELPAIQSAVNLNRMPKGQPLSDDLKLLLNTWIDNGAPEKPDLP